MGKTGSQQTNDKAISRLRAVDPDAGEKKAYNVIRHFPVFGQLYSGIRAAVYASKGDEEEAKYSRKGMVYGYQYVADDIPTWGLKKVGELSGKAVEAVKQKAKDKVYENRYTIGATVALSTAAFTGLCYWWSSSSAVAERKREDRSRLMVRQEITASQQHFRIMMKEENEALELRIGARYSNSDGEGVVGEYAPMMTMSPVWNISFKDYMMVFSICVLLVYIRAFVSGD
ncbi:hypothetical protein E8E11_009109 [Didymella keratinophila]|nr:hypothetical protein E8E11_009109 [Didymella keratinophila]